MAEIISQKVENKSGTTLVEATTNKEVLAVLLAKFAPSSQKHVEGAVSGIETGLNKKSKEFMDRVWKTFGTNIDKNAKNDPAVKNFITRIDAINGNSEKQDQNALTKLADAFFKDVKATTLFPGDKDVQDGDTITIQINKEGKMELDTPQRHTRKQTTENSNTLKEKSVAEAAAEKEKTYRDAVLKEPKDKLIELENRQASIKNDRDGLTKKLNEVNGQIGRWLYDGKLELVNQKKTLEGQIAEKTQELAKLTPQINSARTELAQAEGKYDASIKTASK